jgi:hypothetical protein
VPGVSGAGWSDPDLAGPDASGTAWADGAEPGVSMPMSVSRPARAQIAASADVSFTRTGPFYPAADGTYDPGGEGRVKGFADKNGKNG